MEIRIGRQHLRSVLAALLFIGVSAGAKASESFTVRLFNVDDEASVYVNDHKIFTEYLLGDSGWRNVNPFLHNGVNKVRLEVVNYRAGWTYGLQIARNSRIIYNEVCGSVGVFGCLDDNHNIGLVFEHTYLITQTP